MQRPPNCINSVMQNKANRRDLSTDFRAFLLAERARLVSGQEGELEVLTTFLAEDHQAPLLQEQFVAISQGQMNRRKLKLVDAALVRFDRGHFGVCQECGEGIPLKRLKIIPWAAYCVDCQERLDQEHVLAVPELLLTA